MTLRGSELHPFGRFKPDKEQTCANGGACGFGERKPCVANGRIIIHNAVVVVNFSKAKRVLEYDRKFSICRIVETTQEHKLDENNMNNIKKLEIKPMSLATVILK